MKKMIHAVIKTSEVPSYVKEYYIAVWAPVNYNNVFC